MVAGYATVSGAAQATIWNGLTATHLGMLGGGSSYAYGIDTLGDAVGSSFNTTGAAFLYKSGSLTNLNTLIPAGSGWNLTAAYAINDSGLITGEGRINGVTHAYLLRPNAANTPAPSSALVLALGLAGLGAGLRRRAQK